MVVATLQHKRKSLGNRLDQTGYRARMKPADKAVYVPLADAARDAVSPFPPLQHGSNDSQHGEERDQLHCTMWTLMCPVNCAHASYKVGPPILMRVCGRVGG